MGHDQFRCLFFNSCLIITLQSLEMQSLEGRMGFVEYKDGYLVINMVLEYIFFESDILIEPLF